MMPGPCVSVLLILNNSDGKEVLRTRTSTNGQFQFEVEPGKVYKIISGTRFYQVVSSKDFVHGGEKAKLQLQQN